MKINFKAFDIYIDIEKKAKINMDISTQIANVLFENGTGIVSHTLAHKIYDGKDLEFNDDELKFITAIINNYTSPRMIDSFSDYINTNNTKL